jgi:uncharacterized protein (DUF2235 family)
MAMAKNIVFCADGTWNGPGEYGDSKDGDPSNVFKLYVCLGGQDVLDAATYRSANEQERRLADGAGKLLQVAKYLHGVGDSENFLVRILGGVLGAGVIARILRGYTFLSRNYERGDRLFIVGFSRGAYTARALAGLVCAKGLLDAHAHDLADKQQAYRLAANVWADYRSAQCEAKGATWVQRMQDLLDDLPRFFSHGREPTLVADVPIEAVAVWDTVGALGIPQYAAERERLDLFRFADTRLNAKVRRGLHCIAIDEQRADFTPTLWEADAARIEQLLFPGAHADVGGGYPVSGKESGLSDGALTWMVGKLADLKVGFMDPPPLRLAPDALGPAHQPWRKVPWNLLPHESRGGLRGLPRDDSVGLRLGKRVLPDPGAQPADYAPASLM